MVASLPLHIWQGKQVIRLAVVSNRLYILDTTVVMYMDPRPNKFGIAVWAPHSVISVGFDEINHLFTRAVTVLSCFLVAFPFDPPQVTDVLVARATSHTFADAFNRGGLGSSGHSSFLEVARPKGSGLSVSCT
jgi:hypothetical protein